MKIYSELSEEQKVRAVGRAYATLMGAILEGAVCFDDERNQDDLQARIDAALAKANDMQTPWFAHEYIMDTCKEEIMGMAQADAENALYAEPTEHVVSGIFE